MRRSPFSRSSVSCRLLDSSFSFCSLSCQCFSSRLFSLSEFWDVSIARRSEFIFSSLVRTSSVLATMVWCCTMVCSVSFALARRASQSFISASLARLLSWRCDRVSSWCVSSSLQFPSCSSVAESSPSSLRPWFMSGCRTAITCCALSSLACASPSSDCFFSTSCLAVSATAFFSEMTVL